MRLGNQRVVLSAVPAARPVLVGPAQAERQVEGRVGQHALERTGHQSTAIEPIMVVAEAMHAVQTRQFDLPSLRPVATQVVESKLPGQFGLLMAKELRHRLRDVGPLGKSPAPPCVVLGKGMELRQIEGNGAQA